MSSPSAGKRRMDTDVIKLIESKHEVTILGGLDEFVVKFSGPKGTPYENGVWKVRVHLPEQYPFKSPSIGFTNKIYHPNIDEVSGTVCLDVINQAWTALYDLSNIFESFLPQLLTYPNPTDPLNGDAAAMYLHRPEEYKKKVAEYVRKYASEEALRNLRDPTEVSSSSESSMSDYSEDEAQVNAPSPTRPETNDDSQRMQAVDLSLKGAEGGNTSSASTLVDTGRQMTSYGRSPSPNSISSNSGNRSPTSAAVARFKDMEL